MFKGPQGMLLAVNATAAAAAASTVVVDRGSNVAIGTFVQATVLLLLLLLLYTMRLLLFT